MTAAVLSPTPQFMRRDQAPEVPSDLREAAQARIAAAKTPAAKALRTAAWEAFARIGIPYTGHEDYSYVSAADLKAAVTRVPDAIAAEAPQANISEELVIENGKLLSAPHLPEGVELFDLNETSVPAKLAESWIRLAGSESDASAALALTFSPSLLVLRIGPSHQEHALRVRLTGKAAQSDAALFVQLEPGSGAKISVTCEDDAPGYRNASLGFRLESNAHLEVAQCDGAEGSQTLKLRFEMERDAHLKMLAVSTGNRLARAAVEADLLDSGSSLDIRGAAAAGGNRRVHRHLRVRHAAPHCESKQVFKTVVLGQGRSSVDGTVTVDRGAQKTDAKQLLQHLMLSKEARADAKPRLLIHADDVKCSHGATVGKMDPEQAFYLRARGLDAASANRLLTQAFLAEALSLCTMEEFRETARQKLLIALSETGNFPEA